MSYFDNIVYKKAKSFSIRIVNLYKYLVKEKQEFVMSKQILRSGTSIGANIAESEYAQSHADFVSKLSISRKEASETIYWLDLLFATNYISGEQFESVKSDCEEILRILTSSILTNKNNNN